MSPYRIVFGFEPKTTIAHAVLPSSDLPTDAKQYIEERSPQLENICDIVRQSQKDANAKTQKYYNVNSKVPTINI